MVRIRLRPFAWLTTVATVGLFVAGTAAVTACSGKVDNGKVSSTSQPVALSAISSTPPTPCNTGDAHPNVCCETGPGQATSCLAYPNAPFAQCASGTTTYPDPRTCCPLDGNGACASPPPTPVDAGAGSGGSCAYACPVGWYSPPSSSGAGSSGTGGGVDTGCCQTLPDGSSECSGGGSTLGSSSGAGSSGGSGGSSCACACPACDPDSGICPPCPPCNCPSQPPPTTTCDACPPGWQTPDGDPLLCCATGSDGTISCFSQGVPPPPPGDVDAGAPTSCFGGGGGGPDGSTFTQCGCSETVDGVDYTVTCTDPGGTCVCSTGTGSTTGTTVTEPPTSCNDLAALFGACGFPASSNQGSAGSGSSGASSSSSGG